MNPKLTKTRNPDQKHRHTKQQPTTDNEKKNIIIMIIHYTILIAQLHHPQNNCTHTNTPLQQNNMMKTPRQY